MENARRERMRKEELAIRDVEEGRRIMEEEIERCKKLQRGGWNERSLFASFL